MKLYFFRGTKEKEAARSMRRMMENKYKSIITKNGEFVSVVNNIRQADYIVACGGDGTFLELEQLRAKRQDISAKLVGIACGTANHLMNKTNNLLHFIRTAQTMVYHPLRITCVTQDGRLVSELGANDVTIHRWSPRNQACHLDVRIGCGENRVSGSIHGDGLVAASAQGAHAYYRNAGGQFMSMWTKGYGTQPICDINAEKLSKVVSADTRVIVDVRDYEKRPVAVYVDNLPAVKNIVRCEIQMEQDVDIPVLVNKKTPFVQANRQMARQLIMEQTR